MLHLGGTYREISAEETFGRVAPLLHNVFGITRVAMITGLDNIGIHTAVAIRPNSKILSTSQGKGVSEILAKVSAVMEAIELWHGENLPEPELFGSFEQLKQSYPVCSLEALLPALFFPEIDRMNRGWVPVRELLSQTECYLPHTLFNQDKVDWGQNFELFWPSSNGLASGNSIEEAICHALYELIERDSLAKIKPLALSHRLMDLAHLPAGLCQELVGKILAQNYELKLYDIRSNLNIPCYLAVIDDFCDIRNISVFGGYGCHLVDEIAILRAVTEAAQSRLTYISGSRDDIDLRFYKNKRQKHANRIKGQHKPTYTRQQPVTFSDCLKQILACLKEHGHRQVYACNLTRPDINIPVVHMVVPSLLFEHEKHLFKLDHRL